jgi:hypothetical protein
VTDCSAHDITGSLLLGQGVGLAAWQPELQARRRQYMAAAVAAEGTAVLTNQQDARREREATFEAMSADEHRAWLATMLRAANEAGADDRRLALLSEALLGMRKMIVAEEERQRGLADKRAAQRALDAQREAAWVQAQLERVQRERDAQAAQQQQSGDESGEEQQEEASSSGQEQQQEQQQQQQQEEAPAAEQQTRKRKRAHDDASSKRKHKKERKKERKKEKKKKKAREKKAKKEKKEKKEKKHRGDA